MQRYTHPNNPKNASNELGTALTELALVLPFLLVTVFGVIEIGRWLNIHLTASRIAFEAVRFAASYPGLEDNQSQMGTNESNCSSVKAGHCVVLNRVQWILNRYNAGNSKNIPAATITIDKQSQLATTPNNWVSVSVSIPFKPIFAWFLGKTEVHSAARAAYLFPTSFNPGLAATPTPIAAPIP